MSNAFRKIRRNALKKHLGTNKIKEFYHSEYDSLEKKMKRAKEGGYGGWKKQ